MGRLRTGHLTVRSGKTVIVHLRSGEKIEAKFKEKRHKYIEFFDHEPIKLINIRTLSIRKLKPEVK